MKRKTARRSKTSASAAQTNARAGRLSASAAQTSELRSRPKRIRTGDDYSVESMRQVHEGRAVYDDTLSALGLSAQDEIETARQTPVKQTRRRRRKKHKLLRFLLLLLGLLLGMVLVTGALSALFAVMPESDQPIGPRKPDCSTVLLCGTDEDGTRTDTMLLLYLDRVNQTARLLSLPRDTMVNRESSVPKLNGAYGANGRGEAGMNVLMDYVKDLVGFRPDGYMLLDLNCFADLVDTMGGVTYDVPMDMEYKDPTQDLYIDLKAGTQKLNGQEAMWLVRYRSGYAMADLERVRVQRDFLGAAISQWKSITRLPRVPFAAMLLIRNTQTDLNYRNLCWIAMTLARCGSEGLESDTLPGAPVWVNGGAYYEEDRHAAAALVTEKYNPYEREITANDLHPYGY